MKLYSLNDGHRYTDADLDRADVGTLAQNADGVLAKKGKTRWLFLNREARSTDPAPTDLSDA